MRDDERYFDEIAPIEWVMITMQMTFIFLKIFDQISWSWWEVFVPVYTSIALALIRSIYMIIVGDDE